MRGCCPRIHARSRIPLNAAPRNFSVVPGTKESGRTWTSTVARAGCSDAGRAAIGPLTEARAEHVSPKVKRAEPSTPASAS